MWKIYFIFIFLGSLLFQAYAGQCDILQKLSDDNLDPRLEKLTRILHEQERVASKIKSVDEQYLKTVANLWPQHKLDKILTPSSIYKEPITQYPLMTKAEFLTSLKRKKVSQEIAEILVLVDVNFRGHSGDIYTGQIVVHKYQQGSIRRIFKRIILETDFRMTSVIPLSRFDWDQTMRFNNSGGFDWRLVKNSLEVTDHLWGGAVDINPLINPWLKNGTANYYYDSKVRGTLLKSSAVVKIFKEEGWKWGGDWEHSKDWQHFYRPEIPLQSHGKKEVKE